MAHVTKLFMGFEESSSSDSGITVGSSWSLWAKPPGVYHRSATASRSTTSIGTYTYGAYWSSGGRGLNTVQASAGRMMIGGNGIETGATRTTRIAAAGGVGIGVDRDMWLGTDAAEGYFQFDVRFHDSWSNFGGGVSRTETNVTFTDPVALFKWGDVGVWAKSVVWNATLPTTIILTLSVRNNGTEVATITLPEQASTNFFYIKIYAKLHASAGEILVTANTSTMSSAYSGANTVQSTAVADADFIYFQPIALDNGTTLEDGFFDNVWIGTTGFPTGRPTGYVKLIASDGTLSGWAAEGTGATTLTDALTGNGHWSDAKAARGSGSGASALLNLTSLDTTGLEANLIGYTIIAGYVSNRDQTTPKRLSLGMSSAGVHTMGPLAAAIQPPLAYNSVPPAEVYTRYIWEGLYIDSTGTAFPSSSLHSVRLLTI